jgi:hypothetical protein
MFEAQYHTACADCDGNVWPGELVRYNGDNELVHMSCGRDESSSDVVRPGKPDDVESSRKSNPNLGNVACDGYGNVIARMTGNGWHDVG